MRDIHLNFRNRGRAGRGPDDKLSRRLDVDAGNSARPAYHPDTAGQDGLGEKTRMVSVHDRRDPERDSMGDYENLYASRMMTGYMKK